MSHDDFEIEPVPGLPEKPPAGEEILWQGRPDWWALSLQSLNVGWVALYFVGLTLWRLVSVIDQMSLVKALAASFPLLVLGAVVCGLLMLTAYIQARCTMYTVTNRRIAMRIGAALTVTLNLPYTQVGGADLDLRKGGIGSIALSLLGDTKLSYLVCWPHVRPWAMTNTQPALRCIPEAEKVAALIAEAAEQRISTPRVAQRPVGAAIAAE